MKPGNCGKLNEDLPPAGQPPSGALARNKHQILVHTLRTIFRRCMRRGVVTKKVCPGFQVWGGAKKSIQQRHSNNQSNTQSKSKIKIKGEFFGEMELEEKKKASRLENEEQTAVWLTHVDPEDPQYLVP